MLKNHRFVIPGNSLLKSYRYCYPIFYFKLIREVLSNTGYVKFCSGGAQPLGSGIVWLSGVGGGGGAGARDKAKILFLPWGDHKMVSSCQDNCEKFVSSSWRLLSKEFAMHPIRCPPFESCVRSHTVNGKGCSLGASNLPPPHVPSKRSSGNQELSAMKGIWTNFMSASDHMSRTHSGMFFAGAFSGRRRRKRTNREIPEKTLACASDKRA